MQFTPPAGLRPGQIGTLIDEVANPVDVTATIIDLAVRGFLRIEEITNARAPRSRTGGSTWCCRRRPRSSRPTSWR